MLHVLDCVHMLPEFDIHLDLLLTWHCTHDEVIIILTDQCWGSLGIRRLSRRCGLLALHVGVVFEGTFVTFLTVALQPSVAIVVLLSSRCLRSSRRG